MDSSVILMFLGIATLSHLTTKNFARGMIREIGVNRRYYPKHYAIPPRWIRKVFKLEKREIPRFICNEFVVSLFFALLGPLNALTFILSSGNMALAGMLGMIHICMILIDFIYVSIIYFIFKKICGNSFRRFANCDEANYKEIDTCELHYFLP